MTGSPWVCSKCGETVTPLDEDELWHYVRTGESRCTPCPKGTGMARPHTMSRAEMKQRRTLCMSPSERAVQG